MSPLQSSATRDAEHAKDVVDGLCALPKEAEWVEFKRDNRDPEEIGRNISAIANASAIHGKAEGYLVWGIDDASHEVLGTDFKPSRMKVGNEELENWLTHQLSPRIDIELREFELQGRCVTMIIVPAASHTPVRFRTEEFIRVGSYTKKLKDHPEKERRLWRLFEQASFEDGVAAARVTSDDVLELIDYPSAFRLLGYPLPDNRVAILERLEQEWIIRSAPGDRFDVTNLGAILFAVKLSRFRTLSRKALRIIVYTGLNRIETDRENLVDRGYAVAFEEIISYINSQLPQNEYIERALRRESRMYPEIAVRELVANALIHQDFHVRGAGPMVEIFKDRMEISNPGIPLIDTLRFIDEPPRSRNEALAAMMRRMAICEERGTGIDKVVFQIEAFQLPAPEFRATSASTLTVLHGPRPFAAMDRQDRIRACYQHACLWHVSGKRMTNASLRQRLAITQANYPIASRIIRDTIDARYIKPHHSNSRREASYLPFWA